MIAHLKTLRTVQKQPEPCRGQNELRNTRIGWAVGAADGQHQPRLSKSAVSLKQALPG